MKKQINYYSSIVLLIITFCCILYAQEQTVQGTELKEEESVSYKISEIPSKLEETQTYISKLNTDIISPEKVTEREKELEIVNESYKILRAQTDSIDLEKEYSTTLKEYQQKWITQKNKVSDWASLVKSRTEELEETKKQLLANNKIWERTDKLAREEGAPSELINSIRDLINSINKIEKDLTTEINSSLSLQTRLSEQSIDIDLTLGNIEELLQEKERKVFVQNVPAIWESFSVVEDSTALSVQLSKIWKSYIRTSEEFLETNKDRMIQDFVLFLFFLLLVYLLRHYSRNIEEKDEKTSFSLRLLERPISVAILVFLLFAVTLYEDAPEIFFNLLRILVVLPLLRILFHILKPILRIPLIYFCALMIIQQFMIAAGSGTPVERGLLIILVVLAIAGLSWFLLLKVPVRAFDNEVTSSRLFFIGKLSLFLFVIGFLANIFGYVMLNFVIINGILNSIYGIILLLTAVLALKALINISLQTKPLLKFNVVKIHPEKIKITLAKIIKIVVIIWSLIIIMKNFLVQDEIIDWLTETLGKVWEIGDLKISIGNILLFFISIWLAVQIARLVRFLLEGDVLPRFNLARGVPGAISSITNYLIVGFGIIVAMVAAGIDLSSFALLAGALGVGIGFGLQDLVRNFVSGLILIFERPIQTGDAVQVDDLSGRVLKIGIRSSIIKTWDGAEVILPNGNLIANKLINWTLSDQLRRIDIKVGVAYGTDVATVMKTLLKCAKDHQQILTNPAPYVLFNDFADSYLEFELRCWTSNYPDWIFIRSDIRIAIDKAFEEENIVIPFPQRDLHVKSGFDFPGANSDIKDKTTNKNPQK
jgi:small-conductance mechanosensitive channel